MGAMPATARRRWPTRPTGRGRKERVVLMGCRDDEMVEEIAMADWVVVMGGEVVERVVVI